MIFKQRVLLLKANNLCIPELRVTGMVFAVGQTILTWLCLTSAKVDAQPWPVSPNPCKKINVAVCLPLGETTTGAILELRFEAGLQDWPIYTGPAIRLCTNGFIAW